MGKVKTTAAVFELPQRLGIPQYVEYEPPPKEQCTNECLYEGLLTAEGCRKGVCVKYRVWVWSKDRRRWEAKERWRGRDVELGGCLRQAVAEALWELAEKYDVGVWYNYQYRRLHMSSVEVLERKECGIVLNGVKLSKPRCNSAKECIELILEDYKREVEKLKEPPAVSTYNPAEELLMKYPELAAFGAEWTKKWAPHARDRLIEIAETLSKHPWMAEAARRESPEGLNPYAVEIYVAKDGSVACLSLGQLRMHCAQNGTVKAVKLELEYVRHEMYEGARRGVYRPKGLLAFSAFAKEYVKIL